MLLKLTTVLLLLCVWGLGVSAWDDPGALLQTMVEESPDMQGKLVDLEILKKQIRAGIMGEDEGIEMLKELEADLLLIYLGCWQEIQELRVEIIINSFALQEQQLTLENTSAELQAAQLKYDLGLIRERELDEKKGQYLEAKGTLARQEKTLAGLITGWQNLFPELPAAADYQDLVDFPHGIISQEEALNLAWEKDKQLTSLKQDRESKENALEARDPYFTPAVEMEIQKLQLDKLKKQIATRKTQLTGQVENYYRQVESLQDGLERLNNAAREREQDYEAGRLRYERGLITSRSMEGLELAWENILLDIFKTRLDLYRTWVDIYVFLGEAQLWWDTIEAEREGLEPWPGIEFWL